MLFYFACEAAGASAPGIPHALPLGKAENSRTPRTPSRRENADTRDPHSVIAREGGRSSIAEELMINREAAAYWIPAFAGMTAGPTTNAICLRMRAQKQFAPTATHHPSSPRTRGPITTGSSLCRSRPAASLNTSGTGYGSLRPQGRHRCWDDADVIATTATHHSPLVVPANAGTHNHRQ